MKRLFKRSATVLLVLVLIFSMTAMSVSAFVPPGQAKKMVDVDGENLPQHGWARWFGWRFLDDDYDSEDLEGLPPGIAKKGIPLPPGLMRFVNDPDKLPPGIWNRFMERWQERERDEDEEREVTEVWDRDDLEEAVNEEAEEIKLMDDITIFEALLIDWDLYLDGNGFDLEAGVDFEDEWMIEVTEDAHLTMRDLTIIGYDEDELEGLIKVEEDATLTADDNELNRAPIGIAFWLDVDLDDIDQDELEELLEELEEKADDLEDNNEFDDVDEPVVYYDEDDDMIYPEE